MLIERVIAAAILIGGRRRAVTGSRDGGLGAIERGRQEKLREDRKNAERGAQKAATGIGIHKRAFHGRKLGASAPHRTAFRCPRRA